MSKGFPGPKTLAALRRGIPLFKNGQRFDRETEHARRRGLRPVRQIVVDRAAGDFVWDLDGRRYIDFQNGWATNPLGNCHPEILEAVEGANRRYGFHYDHPLRYDLAERLADIMPGQALPRTNFEVSGTEAAEAAVQLALTHAQRRYIITFASSYHGNSLATKVLSGMVDDTSPCLEAWGGGVIKAPYPYSEQLPAGMSEEQYTEYCLWYLDNHIPSAIAHRDHIAGILVEPGLAEGGNWIPSTRFIQGIRALCDKNNWLMIADEVLTGVGRTGRMWAIEHYVVEPDILVYGKNLSGGIAPLAGVSARDDILGDNPHFDSGSTFAGTPAGCAAALKTLEIFSRDNVVEHAQHLGQIAASITQGWERFGIVRQARGNGLLLGVSFQAPADRDDNVENWWVARAVRGYMLERGVWAISAREDTIRMYPALTMDEAVLREGLEIMEEAIAHVEETGLSATEGDSAAYPSGVAGF